MSRDCRYICHRAANAIISEVGMYRVSTDALHGINQFLDEFLVQLLVDCQSLDLSRIKASIFNLLPSTLGKNAIVEAELEVKTFTETETVDYTVYEKMRKLGQEQPCFPTKTCLALLRDKCLEYCTLADKDDQQSWLPQQECNDDVIVSPIVAVYVTTVLEHMAEYILTAVAMTAETEDTDYVRIKELFLALVDDIQVGVVFQAMDLRDKMEKRSFAHGYLPRSSTRPASTPIRKQQVRYSTSSTNRSGSSSRGLTIDELDLHYNDDDNTTSSSPPSGFGAHTSSISNYSVLPDNTSRPTSTMPSNTSNNTQRNSSKRAYKVFKNDHHSSNIPSSELHSFSVYDPDAPTMNFEDLIRSGNTMRVSLTPNRLKSIETKDQMADDPVPSKFAWKRRSPSAAQQSTSARSQTPTSARIPSSLVKSGSILSNRGATRKGRKGSNKTKSRKNDTRSDHSPLHDAADLHLSDVSSLSSFSSTNKHVEKSLPTPTSSTSSRKSKKRPPVSSVMALPSSPSIASSMKSSSTRATLDSTSLTSAASSISISSTSSSLGLVSSTSANRSSAIGRTSTTTTQPIPLSPAPTLRRSSLSSRKSRENIRRQKGKSEQPTTTPIEGNAGPLSTCQPQQRERSASVPVKSNTVIPYPLSSSLQQYSKDPGLSLARSSSTTLDTKPERPSSYVAKRISTTNSPHPPTPYESYAINNNVKECEAQKEPVSSFTSARPLSTAGTVGNTIKQLDQMAKQRSSLSNVDFKAVDSSLEDITTTTTATTIRSRSRQFSSPLSCTATTTTSSSSPHRQLKQNTTIFRRSMVLDKVLQFERAHSMDDNDDVANRRASSYIPRRDRLMFLQKDLHSIERPRTAIFTSTGDNNIIPIVRPGTSAMIAAAAARFAAGVSMAIQTDTKTTCSSSPCVADSNTTALGSDGNSNSNSNSQDGGDDILSEHGVVVGDEEWFLPEDEWEDAQEQEHAVVDWLLGEAC